MSGLAWSYTHFRITSGHSCCHALRVSTGATVPQSRLSGVMVIQALVVPRRFVHVLAGVEVPSPQQVGDTTVEAFDYAVGPGPLGTDQAMLDPVLGTQPVEGVMPHRLALSGHG